MKNVGMRLAASQEAVRKVPNPRVSDYRAIFFTLPESYGVQIHLRRNEANHAVPKQDTPVCRQ